MDKGGFCRELPLLFFPPRCGLSGSGAALYPDLRQCDDLQSDSRERQRPLLSRPVRPTKLGIIGLGAIGGSLALQAKRAAPAAPHPPLGALADRAQVEIAPLDRAARP